MKEYEKRLKKSLTVSIYGFGTTGRAVYEKVKDNFGGKITITCDEEAALVKTLSQYEEKVLTAIRDYEPSVIARFILDVAAAYNKFYHNCQILSAEDSNVRGTRILLTEATKNVLGSAFSLICLKKTERI